MKSASYYLDLLNDKGFSDYRIAKMLGVESSSIAAIRKGKASGFSDVNALKIAEFLDMPAIHVIADMHHARSKSPAVSAFWKSVRQTVVCAAITVCASQSINVNDLSGSAHNV